MIVGRLVVAHCTPVTGFGGGRSVRLLFSDISVDPLRLREFFLFKRYSPQSHCELRLEVFLRKIALDAMPFRAGGIQEDDGWGPSRIEAMEPDRVLFDVSLDGEEIGVDEGRDAFIRVRLGFQPSTSSSSGSRAEIEQDGPARLPRFLESRIDIFPPFDCHRSLQRTIVS